MAAVTQLVQNFLGGVSTQVDDKKLPGQVRAATNAYPDPTFGMLKRNGMRFIRTVNKADGTPFTDAELDNAAWFFIQRGPQEAFIGAIKGTNIYVWDTITGQFCTVTNEGAGYLTAPDPSDYQFRTIQDVTIVTNRGVDPKLQPRPTGYAVKKQGTILLKIVEYSATYKVKINGTEVSYSTRNGDVLEPPEDKGSKMDATEILNGIKAAIDGGNFGVTVTVYPTSLELTSNSAFELEATGGINNRALTYFQDNVNNLSELPAESRDGRTVEVLNSGGDEDNYWLKHIAVTQEWKETKDPRVSPGFDASTFPHELAFTDDTSLTFKPIPWADRNAGSDATNPPPSIFDYNETTKQYDEIGTPINATFFYNNRFGLLSGDNVILSQSNAPYNFFNRSALTQTASDPIDLNAASVLPVELFNVLPDSQGLLLFSKRQQFLMFATGEGTLTPTTAVIRGISNYEMDENIAPVDIGTTIGFISKVPSYTRAFTLQTRGLEEPPVVIDLSKTVAEYIPDGINHLVSSPQNSFIAMSKKDTNELYIYRYFNNGNEDLFQAWVKWQLPGKIQVFSVINDMMFVVTQQKDQYTLGLISLNDIPLGTVFTEMPSRLSSPVIDMVSRPTGVTYDSGSNKTTFTVGYTPLDQAAILLLVPTLQTDDFQATFDLAGFNFLQTQATDDDIGYWRELTTEGNSFTLVGDWTQYKDNMLVGYNYDFSLDLPTFYYNMAEEGSAYDYTASLTINRAKISSGKTGAVTFKIKPKGSDEWVDIQATTDASYYEADTSPVNSERRFVIPINQRNTNFDMKISSALPYPVSLVSMMWEGQYTPRYYKRS